MTMPRVAFVAGLFAALFLNTPASALTAKEKQDICNFGADDQKLTGGARKTFLTKCMAKEDAPAKPKKKMTAPAGAPASK
jgi:hypothetical protein